MGREGNGVTIDGTQTEKEKERKIKKRERERERERMVKGGLNGEDGM